MLAIITAVAVVVVIVLLLPQIVTVRWLSCCCRLLFGWLVGSLAGARLTGCCNAKRSQPIAGLWQCPCCYCCNCSAYKGISAMRKSRVQQIA